MLTFLVFGDVVGKIGREAVIKSLPELKAKYRPDLTIANVENIAHGVGVNLASVTSLAAAGVDIFTSGNHVFKNPGVYNVWTHPELGPRLLRPENFPGGTQGLGSKSLEIGGKKVLVVNLIGQVFMKEEYASPFEAFEKVLKENPGHDVVLVDFHGEATSEKVAFGIWADGRATAVWGTHTHVPTADARILPNGTAYLTDVGMVGARYSVLGVEPKGPISHFTEVDSTKFEMPESGPADLGAVVIHVDPEDPQGREHRTNQYNRRIIST